MVQNHLYTQTHKQEEYSIENPRVIAMIMCHINAMFIDPRSAKAHQFVQSYSLMSGLKKFSERGREAAYKEMKQLYDRVVFRPIHIEDLTELEKQRAMESLIFLVEIGIKPPRVGHVQMVVLNESTWEEMTRPVLPP